MRTFGEYVEGVRRTASGGPNQLAVCALGLCGEASEIGYAPASQIIDELGDFMWYIGALCIHTGVELNPTFRTFQLSHEVKGTAFQTIADMSMAAGLVAEHVKKHIGHGKPLDTDKVSGLLLQCLACAAEAATLAGVSLEAVAEHNIDKLKKRYPAGFDLAIAAAKPDGAA